MRFDVELYDPDCDDWEPVGSVLLPQYADELAVEGALAALGIYAPRGADELDWGCVRPMPENCAYIYDANGVPMIRLAGHS